MAIDMTSIGVASVIGGTIVAVISSTFGSKIKPECKERHDMYQKSIRELELKTAKSDEYKISLELRMASMDKKLDSILSKLTKGD